MTQGLSVARLIDVAVNLAPQGAQFANVDSLLVLGNSNVIDVSERIRSYNLLADVASDFGTNAPEYLAARNYFSQVPQPTQLYIGRWAYTATAALLKGAPLPTADQDMSLFTVITNGSLSVVVDGDAYDLTGIDLSAETNLNGVASAVTTEFSGAATVTWTGSQFVITSATTGASSTIAAATPTGVGVDLALLMLLRTADGATTVQGHAAETAVAAVQLLDTMPTQWYGLMVASANVVDADHLAIAAYIEGTPLHIYGVGTTSAAALVAASSSDIGAQLKAFNYKRTLTQWSSSDPYAVASLFGREFTVDYQGNNTVISLMYKQEPGILAENLTSTQADALIAKRYNFYVNYNNNTAILQNGVMVGPYYIDEVHGTDALANEIQTNVYNLLYTTPTKIPQTDAGIHRIVNVIEATCAAFVSNGLLAAGTWTTAGFGTLEQGDFLERGFYVYAPPIAAQATADRAARKSPPIQVAAKLAGAVNTVNVIVNVNR